MVTRLGSRFSGLALSAKTAFIAKCTMATVANPTKKRIAIDTYKELRAKIPFRPRITILKSKTDQSAKELDRGNPTKSFLRLESNPIGQEVSQKLQAGIISGVPEDLESKDA